MSHLKRCSGETSGPSTCAQPAQPMAAPRFCQGTWPKFGPSTRLEPSGSPKNAAADAPAPPVASRLQGVAPTFQVIAAAGGRAVQRA
jgi:hypothetical protein